jgi:hypothetical protein
MRDLRWRKLSASKRGSRLAGPIFYTRIRAPKIWNLYDKGPRQELARFIKEYKAVMLQGNGGAIVDFSLTELIYPAGGLLVYAELDRISRLVKDRRRLRCKPAAKKSVVDQVLKQVGMYEALDHTSDALIKDQSVVHWRNATGIKVDGERSWSVVENFEGELSDALQNSLGKGISEALANAVHHAYEAKRMDGINIQGDKRWWMFSQERDGFLTIVFCDLGIGIPRSLPLKKNNNLNELLKKLRADNSDVESIKIASKLGETRTLQDNRGKGFPQIIDAVRNAKQGNCTISSNRGQYGISSDGKVFENQFSNSIYGTLIEWRLPLTEDSINDS